MIKRALILSLGLIPSLLAEEKPAAAKAPPTTEAKAPAVKQISTTCYQIGSIVIDKEKRSISFPAHVEQNRELLEYIVVNPIGKIHEALFIADIQASHLNIAFKLLGYQESKELYRVLDKDYTPTDKYHEVSDEIKKQARFDIQVTWKKDGKERCESVHKLLQHSVTKKAIPPAAWVYGGSYIHNGRFKADLTGDLIALFTDNTCLANFSGEGREDDMIWMPHSSKLPEKGTPVTLTILPWEKDSSKKNQ